MPAATKPFPTLQFRSLCNGVQREMAKKLRDRQRNTDFGPHPQKNQGFERHQSKKMYLR